MLKADLKTLPETQQKRYRAVYCGLCRAIGGRCGQLCRLTLTYDSVFLLLVQNSLYEPEETEERRSCPVHPFRSVDSSRSSAADYAADMNVMLAHLKCLDDRADEHSLRGSLGAALFRRRAAEAAERNPRQWSVMQNCMAELREIERRREPMPDPGANAFGRLLGEVFAAREDHWTPVLRSLGGNLGRFLYLLDAVLDREEDLAAGRYNPVRVMTDDGTADADFRDILVTLMADAAADWERLPLIRDASLQRSILYSGVWSGVGFLTEAQELPDNEKGTL